MAKFQRKVTIHPKVEKTEVVTSEVATEVEKVETPKIDMGAILERLDKLEKENAELREGKMNVFTEGKKVYEGPRAYCYKMWGGVPVVGFTSYRKDKTKDLVFKNPYGVWESNHYLKLELADGSSVDVEVNEFNRDYTLSEKIIAEPRTDNRGHLLGYAFNSDDYGEFVVAPNIINE